MIQRKSQNEAFNKDKKAESLSREELSRRFYNPPPEYGPIDCWWLEADHLKKDRMKWQLEEMKEKGVAGTWLYPKYVKGQRFSPDPAYWTDEWWDFIRFSLEEQQRLDMVQLCNDWLGRCDKSYWQSQVRAEREQNPALTGQRLVIHQAESSAPGKIQIEIPPGEEVLHAAAYRKTNGGIDYASQKALNDFITENGLTWEAKEAGWLATVITSQPHDLDYLNRVVVNRWLEIFLSVYEEKLPDFMGDILMAYGPDERSILNGNILCSPSLLERFKAEKGYDPADCLVGMFHDIGQKTDKIRCDYYETMVDLLEENWYSPVAEWLHERGMLYADFCPYGKNGDILTQTYHYGDFFRFMRNYDMTGAEEQKLRPKAHTFFAKTASSIAHIYGKKRVGVCAYWGSGWGHTTEQNLKWTNENYALGVNLYNRHGVLYTTLGGWYEFVPPAIHFRQPYWQYWRHFTDYMRRLSYVMSQGVHIADVAILYPLTTVHANWSGQRDFSGAAEEAASETTNLAKLIYESGMDFDFIDYPSLYSAKVSDGKLEVSGMEFRVIVLPPMTTIRTKTLKKIKEFYDGGGTIVAFRRLPKASPEKGRDDPEIQSMLQEIFGIENSDEVVGIVEKKNEQGGKAFFLPDDKDGVLAVISNAIVQDVAASEEEIVHTHQKIDEVDVYFLFNAREEQREISFVFRNSGEPEVWNAFTGEIKPVHRFQHQESGTEVRLRMEPHEGVLLAFVPSQSRPQVLEDNLATLKSVEPGKDGIEVQGFCDTGGKKKVRVAHSGKEYVSEVDIDEPEEPIILDGLWDFLLEPTMNNQWGDFRHPPTEEFIGAEARRFRYMEEGGESGTDLDWHKQEFDDSNWQEVTYSYGPYWWSIGPFEEGKEPEDLLEKAKEGKIGANRRYKVAGESLQWQRYSFSQRYGYEEKEVHNKMGDGLDGVSENFLVFAATGDDKDAARYLFSHVYSPEDEDYLLNFGGKAEFQRKAWINGQQVISLPSEEAKAQKTISLKAGWNSILLELVQPKGDRIETFVAFQAASDDPSFDPYVPLLKWFVSPQKLVFDVTPGEKNRMGWYRFSAPPGLKSMKLNCHAKNVTAWINGQPVKVADGIIALDSPLEEVSQVALSVEQESGCYAGAAFHLPVIFSCEKGKIPAGDWCDYSLETYSGGAVYSKSINLGKRHLSGKVLLDLGQVSATAEAHVNGKPAGIRMGRPFRFDITDLVQEGENQIQVKVVNTLANHMSSYPTRYVYEGQTISGLLGPVSLQFHSKAILTPTPGV